MALKAIIDKLEDVAEAVQGEYTAKEGKFFLQVDAVDGYDLQDISGMRKVLDAVKNDRAELRGKLESAESDRGSLNRKVTDLEATQDAKSKDAMEKYKAELTAEYKEKFEANEAENTSLKTRLDDVEIRQAATAILADSGFTKNGIDLMLNTEIKNRMKRVDGDIKFVDERGEELQTEGFQKYTPDTFIKERLAGQYPELVKSDLKPGMGANGGSPGGGEQGGGSVTTEEVKNDPRAAARSMLDKDGKPIEGSVVNTK